MHMWTIAKKRFFFLIFLIGLPIFSLMSRHPFRLPNPDYPKVTAYLKHQPLKKYQLISPYVRLYPLFGFKTEDLYPSLLPYGNIKYRTSNESVSSNHLRPLIEKTVEEIKSRKRKIRKNKQLEYFKILQDKNFNYKKSCGLIVLKFKKHPFVLKLFMENPNTILNYRATGMEPTFFFYMGGGSSRHLCGFTRIKNRATMAQKIKQYKQWVNHVQLPRKWFWLPKKQSDIILTGQNIGGHDYIETHIPSIYGIIADEFDLSKETKVFSRKIKSRIIMQLCNDLELLVDPHTPNFTFIEDKARKKFDIIIVDTEHCPTMVGLKEVKKCKTHNGWYIYLVKKCINDVFLQTKRSLLQAQTQKSKLSFFK